jgi:hypothetical protein
MMVFLTMAQRSEWVTKLAKRVQPQQSIMAPPKHAKPSNQEGRIQLAKQSIKRGQIQFIRAAAERYDVHFKTLR